MRSLLIAMPNDTFLAGTPLVMPRSATLLFDNLAPAQQSTKRECLAFAYSDDTEATGLSGSFAHLRNNEDFNELPGSAKELKAISHLAEGAYFYGNHASEHHFKKEASQYHILHLALHGKSDTIKPLHSYIRFPTGGDSTEDGHLYSYELYQMQLKAQLAVLSACETHQGRQISGEGLMGLSRAFQYTGVPSLVASLWQVDDHTTATLMTYFYEALAAGQKKDVALQTARHRYLTSNLQASPGDWANFILIGNTEPIKLDKPVSYRSILSGVAVTLLLMLTIVLVRWKKGMQINQADRL